MQEAYRERCPQISYRQMDVRQMNYFEDERFNLVIDKATFDDVVCGPGAGQNSVAMLEEIYRVLANNGTYICISHGPPEVESP